MLPHSQLHRHIDRRPADGTTFEFTANAQIWPRSLNPELGGDTGKIYLITSDLGSNSGQGLDFISACPSYSSSASGD